MDITLRPRNKLDKLLARIAMEKKQWRREVDREKKVGGSDKEVEEEEDELEDEDEDDEEGEAIDEDGIRLLVEQCQAEYGIRRKDDEEREGCEFVDASASTASGGEGLCWEETKENLRV